jgi:hypothetical protein
MTRPATVPGLALRLALCVIRAACRVLPEAERAERELEWSAEAEAISGDAEARVPGLRAVRYALSLLLRVRATCSTRAAPAQVANPHMMRDGTSASGSRVAQAAVAAGLFTGGLVSAAVGGSVGLLNGLILVLGVAGCVAAGVWRALRGRWA